MWFANGWIEGEKEGVLADIASNGAEPAVTGPRMLFAPEHPFPLSACATGTRNVLPNCSPKTSQPSSNKENWQNSTSDHQVYLHRNSLAAATMAQSFL